VFALNKYCSLASNFVLCCEITGVIELYGEREMNPFRQSFLVIKKS